MVERLLVCYEAGYDGFWLARSIKAKQFECRVLDPASLQVNRRARRVKTDRIDVLMLVRALMAVDRGDRHVCSIVRVPSVAEEDARRSHRERHWPDGVIISRRLVASLGSFGPAGISANIAAGCAVD